MNAEKIIFNTPKGEYSIPNRWELLSPEHFLYLCALISQYASGNATSNDVRLFFVCRVLDVDLKKIKDPDAVSNLTILADQVDFIFDIDGKVNICFLKQLVPELKIGRKKINGYEINTSFDTLTCSLTAAQFIEAQETLKGGADKLPLLASILYCPEPYSSEKAHELAVRFVKSNQLVLHAIALNFQALVTFLFTKTHFSLLSTGKRSDPVPEIATGLAETLYNLSADGMGDINTVKRMPVIEFFSILRKKLIESVRAMHDSKIDIIEISKKTGLPTITIKKML